MKHISLLGKATRTPLTVFRYNLTEICAFPYIDPKTPRTHSGELRNK